MEVNRVIQGHVLDVLRGLPDELVDCVVTSPPYWGLRDYGEATVTVWDGKQGCEHEWLQISTTSPNSSVSSYGKQGTVRCSQFVDYHNRVRLSNTCVKCGAWRGQLGLEPHPQMFIDHLQQIFHELKRVLKKSGSLWLNIGDTFYTKSGSNFVGSNDSFTSRAKRVKIDKGNQLRGLFKSNWLQTKQKLLVPARVAIALQNDGWILRNEVIWHKRNHMPESVQDRLTRAYESVFFFVKSRRYYFDLDAIRRPYPQSTLERINRNYLSNPKSYGGNFDAEKHNKWKKRVTKYVDISTAKTLGDYRTQCRKSEKTEGNPLGANPADVWNLTNEGFKGAHFATMPQKLVKRILKCSCPTKICVKCGKPFNRISKSRTISKRERGSSLSDFRAVYNSPHQGHINVVHYSGVLKKCKCNSDVRQGIVLDPFCGSGTTVYVAHRMGFDWLGIELNPEYCKMTEKRILSHGTIRLDRYVGV